MATETEETELTAAEAWAEAFDLLHAFGTGLLIGQSDRIQVAWSEEYLALKNGTRVLAATAKQPISFLEAHKLVRDILDEDGHEDDCVSRCLRNDCDDDHHCVVCDEEETRG